MTSLTPHRDAAERVIAGTQAALASKYPETAPQAVNVRVVMAVSAALTRALADELDRDVPGTAVTAAAINAIGNAIVSVAGSSTGHARGPLAVIVVNSLLARIIAHVDTILGDDDERSFSSATVDKRAGRA